MSIPKGGWNGTPTGDGIQGMAESLPAPLCCYACSGVAWKPTILVTAEIPALHVPFSPPPAPNVTKPATR